MRFSLLLYLFLLSMSLSVAQGILPGLVTLQNSGNQPVIGAEISSLWANNTLSDENGAFQLIFTGKQAGYEALLKIEKEGYEVVNQEELFHTLTVNRELVKFYLCPQGQWERNALTYYEINEKNLTLRYRQQIERVKQDLTDQQVVMWDSLARLEEQYRGTLAQIRDLSERFAKANLDDVSDLYEEAFNRFEASDIEGAIAVLSDEVLEDQLRRIEKETQAGKELIAIGEEKVVVAEEAIDQGIENYLLKADLLVLDFRFDEAEGNFLKAVEVDTNRLDSRFRYTVFLQQQHRWTKAISQYDRLIALSIDSSQQAVMLNNLGIALTDQNDYARGIPAYEESLKIRRQLAQNNEVIYLPDVAQSLNNLGVALIAQNDYARGLPAYEEVLKLYRQLALDNEAAYLPDVALTLNNLGLALIDQEDYAHGIPAYEEALKMYRQLALDNEAVYLPYVATLVNNLGGALIAQNNYAQGLPAYEEALKIRRQLALKNEVVYLPDVAQTLNNLGVALTAQNDYAQSIPAYQEALRIYRQLAQDNEAVYLPYVAVILINLGTALTDQNDYAQSIPVYEEALQVYRQLVLENEAIYLPSLALILNNLGIALTDQKDYVRGIPAYEESLKIRRQLALDNEAVYLPDVAQSLNNLGNAYKDQNDYVRGIPVYEESLKICRQLALKNEAVYLPYVAKLLNNLGVSLIAQNDYARGVPAYEEALKVYRQLALVNEAVYLSEVATSLNNLGIAYFKQGIYDTALPMMEEAISIRRALARDEIKRFGLEAVASLIAGGIMNQKLDRSEQANALWRSADSLLQLCPDTYQKQEYQELLAAQMNPASPQQEGNSLEVLLEAIELAASYQEKDSLQSQLVQAVEQVYAQNTSDTDVRAYLAQCCGSLSWYRLFTHDYAGAEQIARRGLSLNSSEAWINTNLAHALLLQGEYEDAKAIYQRYRGKAYDETHSWENGCLADLIELEKEGAIPEDRRKDIRKIRKLLNK